LEWGSGGSLAYEQKVSSAAERLQKKASLNGIGNSTRSGGVLALT